eukprot:7089267-Ditylum_brightwellii.AAC.1
MIDAKYLNAIRNIVTNNITWSIPHIFSNLFDTYIDVSSAQIQDLCNCIENFLFDPHKPVNTIFTKINQLADLATIAHNLISEPQKIDYVYLILQLTGKFNSSLTGWNAKPRVDHTWASCMAHFCYAQKALSKTGALTIQDSMNIDQIVNTVSEGINQALMMKDNHQQETSQEEISLVQQLPEMHKLIQ